MSTSSGNAVVIQLVPDRSLVDAALESLRANPHVVPLQFAPIGSVASPGAASPGFASSTFGSPGATPFSPNATLANLGGFGYAQQFAGAAGAGAGAGAINQAAQQMLAAAQLLSRAATSAAPSGVATDSESGAASVGGFSFLRSLRGVLPRYSALGLAIYGGYRATQAAEKLDSEDQQSDYEFGGQSDSGRLERLRHQHDFIYKSLPFYGTIAHGEDVASSLRLSQKEFELRLTDQQSRSDAARIESQSEVRGIDRTASIYGSLGFARTRAALAAKSQNVADEAQAGIDSRQTIIDNTRKLNDRDAAQQALDFEKPDIFKKVRATQRALSVESEDNDRQEALTVRSIKRQYGPAYQASIGEFGYAADLRFENSLSQAQDEADQQGPIVGAARRILNEYLTGEHSAEAKRQGLDISGRLAGATLRANGQIGLAARADFEESLNRSSRNAYDRGHGGYFGRLQDQLNEEERDARDREESFAVADRDSNTRSRILSYNHNPLAASLNENANETKRELRNSTGFGDYFSILRNSGARERGIQRRFDEDTRRQSFSIGADIGRLKILNDVAGTPDPEARQLKASAYSIDAAARREATAAIQSGRPQLSQQIYERAQLQQDQLSLHLLDRFHAVEVDPTRTALIGGENIKQLLDAQEAGRQQESDDSPAREGNGKEDGPLGPKLDEITGKIGQLLEKLGGIFSDN